MSSSDPEGIAPSYESHPLKESVDGDCHDFGLPLLCLSFYTLS